MNKRILILKLTIVIIFITCITNASAQQKISGQITDKDNSPITYATVQLKKDSSGTRLVKGVLSDFNGNFIIKDISPGSYLLEISNIGYQSYNSKITVEENQLFQTGKLVLNTEGQNLREVVISSKKKLIIQKADRIVMNIDQSVLAAGNDLYNILAMAPSLQVANGQIRMQGKSNVLIILDGKRLPGSSLENVLSAIPGDQIDHIDIITNPSAKYDANASGGVIEIFTKKNKQNGWNASIGGNGSVGKRGGGGLNGSFRLSTKKIDFSTNASYSQKTQIEQGFQNRSLYAGAEKAGEFNQQVDFKDNTVKNKNLGTSLNYAINAKNIIGAEFGVTTVTYNGTGDVNSQITSLNQRLETSSQNNINYVIDLQNYNLKYKSSFDSLGSNLVILGSYVNYKNDKTQAFDQTQTDQITNQTNSSRIKNFAPANFDIYTMSADYTKIWHKGPQLEAGVKYTYTSNQSRQATEYLSNDSVSKSTASIGYYEKITAAYLNLNYSPEKKISFQAGFRGEVTNYSVLSSVKNSYFKLFPNIRFDYKFNSDLTSSLGYAKNINRPGYEKLIPFELYIDNYTTQRGNAFLQPEYTHSLFFNQIYKDYSLRLAYTITTDAISDLYQYDANTLRFIATQENFLTSHLWSAALDIPVKPASWWDSNFGVNGFYKDLKFPSPLNPSVINTKSKYYYTLNSFNSFDLKNKWAAELSFYYYSTFFDGLYDIGHFSNLSAGIKKTFLKNRASLKFDISDILYSSNMTVATAQLPAVSNSLIKRDTRRFRLTFKYNISGKNKLKKKGLQDKGNDQEMNRLGI